MRRTACLDRPNIWMDVTQGVNGYRSGQVFLTTGVPLVVAVHEFAHHYDWDCNIEDRYIGRHFAHEAGHRLVDLVWYDWEAPHHRRVAEQFADTLAWLLTGYGARERREVQEQAAWTLLPLVKNPTLGGR